ncbi:MAG: tetratricopeptide repeat protein [Planctomycetota bacterium]|nr:tetratricopeptide repeat protein [Planctomycetota bacterium]
MRAFSRTLCLSVLSASLLANGRAAVAQSESVQQQFAEITRTVQREGLWSLDPSRLTAIGQGVSEQPNDELADALDSGELQMDVKANAGVQLTGKKFPPVFRALGLKLAAETSLLDPANSGSAAVSFHDMFEVSVSPNLNDRTLGVTYTLKSPKSGIVARKIPPHWRKLIGSGGAAYQIVTEYKFKSKQDMLSAIGADMNVVPLMPTTQKLTDRMVDWLRGQPLPKPAGGEGGDPVQAVSSALQDLMPQMFRSAANFESMKAGYALKFDSPTGGVTIRKMEIFDSSSGSLKRTPYVDVVYGKGHSIGSRHVLDQGKIAGIEGGVEAEISYSTLPRAPGPKHRELAAVVRKSGVTKALQAAPATVLPLVGITPGRPNEVVVTVDPKVGGVMLKFDPAMFQGGATEAEVQGIIDQLDRFLRNTGRSGIVLRVRQEQPQLHLVSLSQLVEGASETLGMLTRISGYVRNDSGELFIVGTSDVSRSPIRVELLTVALRAIYRDGTWPAISLDPDPANPAGPQKVRFVSLAPKLRRTEFVKIMVEADYLMKKVQIGTLKPKISGFRTLLDILPRDDADQQFSSRFWLAPVTAPAGDLMETKRGDATATLFQSNVQVLSESMKRVDDMLLGMGEVNPFAQEMATQMTRHYEDLSAEFSRFRDLQTVFDVAKLAAIWRARGVKHAVLEQIANRPVREVEIPPTYPGITRGPLSGGAVTRQRISTKAVMLTDRLTPLIDLANEDSDRLQRKAPQLNLPSQLEIDPAQLAEFSSEMLMNTARRDFAHGNLRAAVRRLDLLLEIEPDQATAKMMRAQALFSLGEFEAARADIDPIVEALPQFQAFRGVLLLYAGKEAEALADVQAAEKAFSDDPLVLHFASIVQLGTLNFAKAEQLSNRLLEIDPLSREGEHMRHRLQRLFRMGREKAEVSAKTSLKISIPVSDALMAADQAMQQKRFGFSALKFEECLSALDFADEVSQPVLNQLLVRERCLFGRAMCLGKQASVLERRGDADAEAIGKHAVAICDDLIQLHPDWPSVYLIKIIACMPDWVTDDAAKGLYQRALGLRNNRDELLDELGYVCGGRENAFAVVGMNMWNQLFLQASDENTQFLQDVLAGYEGEIFADLLTAFRDSYDFGNPTIKPLVKAHENLPEKLPDDRLTLPVVAAFYHRLFKQRQQFQFRTPDPAYSHSKRVRSEIMKCLRITRFPHLDSEEVEEISHLWLSASLYLTDDSVADAMRDMPSVQTVRSAMLNGTVDFDEMDAAFARARRDLADKVAEESTPFIGAVVDLALAYETWRQKKQLADKFGYYVETDAPPESAAIAKKQLSDFKQLLVGVQFTTGVIDLALWPNKPYANLQMKKFLEGGPRGPGTATHSMRYHKTRSRRNRIEDVLKSWPNDGTAWSAIASYDFPRIQALADAASTTTELRTASLIINHFLQVGDLVAIHNNYAGSHIRDVARQALATIKRKQWSNLDIAHDWDRWEIVPRNQAPPFVVEAWMYWTAGSCVLLIVAGVARNRRGRTAA